MGLDELTEKRRHRNVNPDLIPDASSSPSGINAYERNQPSDDTLKKCLAELHSLLERDDGYFRWRREKDSAALHMTWTWKDGAHADRYVYVQVCYWQFWEGLSSLVHKVHSADNGQYHTTPSYILKRP